MVTRRQALAAAAAKLKAAGLERPWFEAQVLLSARLGLSAAEIIGHDEEVLSPAQLRDYEEAVAQRVRRRPAAYIIGKKPFLRWEFIVTEDVLIPRPETEILVETAAAETARQFPAQFRLRLADIGTGSGAIGLSLLKMLPGACLAAVDLSERALQVARENARLLGVLERVIFYAGDLLRPLAGWRELGFHCITANLPYLSRAEYKTLQPEVLHEPPLALVSGADGLFHYRRLLRNVKEYLAPGGLLFVEIGDGQAEEVKKLFIAGGFPRPRAERDLCGKERVVWAKAAK